MNNVTKTNVQQTERWLRLQTKAYKERALWFSRLGMEIKNIGFVEGIHVNDIRKIAYILDIPESKLTCNFIDGSEYPYEYSFQFDGVKIFSVYKEVI